LKVLSLSQVFPRHTRDFVAPFLLHWCEALGKEGINVTFLVPHDEGLKLQESWESVEIKRFRYGTDEQQNLCYRGEMASVAFSSPAGIYRLIVYLFSSFNASRRELLENTYDHFIVHWALPSGIVALFLMLLTGQKYSIISHGTDVRLFSKAGPFKFLLKIIWRCATERFTVSNFLDSKLDLPTTSIPMPLPPFYEDRNISSRKDNQFRILYVGRMSNQKCLHLISEALRISQIPESWRLRIVGDGVTKDQFVNSCESFIDQLEIFPPVQPKELPQHYQAADVFILPSVDEGFGLALIEAMSHGCYLLGANSGAIPEIISDETVGKLFDTHDELRRHLDMIYQNSSCNRNKSSLWFDAHYAPSNIGKKWATALRRARHTD